jgi:hypothetical protein
MGEASAGNAAKARKIGDCGTAEFDEIILDLAIAFGLVRYGSSL